MSLFPLLPLLPLLSSLIPNRFFFLHLYHIILLLPRSLLLEQDTFACLSCSPQLSLPSPAYFLLRLPKRTRYGQPIQAVLRLHAFQMTNTSPQGFNYGSTNTDNSPVTEQQYQNDFTTAQNLVGASGFTSARIYTLIQAGTTNTPTEAIQAAINTKTSLLLGLWGSGGQTGIDNELAALKTAIGQYGSAFTDLIVGISVGSEDLYRISPTGIENMSGVGAGPDVISSYIQQTKSAIAGTAASSKPVGHVDTWTAWVNGSNDAVISNSDFIGVDGTYFWVVLPLDLSVSLVCTDTENPHISETPQDSLQ